MTPIITGTSRMDKPRPIADEVVRLFDVPASKALKDTIAMTADHDADIPDFDEYMVWLNQSDYTPSQKKFLGSLGLHNTHYGNKGIGSAGMKTFSDICLWDGETFFHKVYQFEDAFVEGLHPEMLSSDWRCHLPMDLDELGFIMFSLISEFDWSEITVGELATAASWDRSAIADMMDRDAYDTMDNRIARHRSLASFRTVSEPYDAFLWLAQLQRSDAEDPTLIPFLVADFPVEQILQFFYAGIWDAHTIRHAIENDIDFSIITQMISEKA
jgi:hypothetical protein